MRSYELGLIQEHQIVLKIPIEDLPSEWLPGRYPTYLVLNRLLINLKKKYRYLDFQLVFSHVGELNYLARPSSYPLIIHKITHLKIIAGKWNHFNRLIIYETIRKVQTLDNYDLKYWFTLPPSRYSQLNGVSPKECDIYLNDPDHWFIKIYKMDELNTDFNNPNIFFNILKKIKLFNQNHNLNIHNDFEWEYTLEDPLYCCINKQYCRLTQPFFIKGIEMISNDSRRLIPKKNIILQQMDEQVGINTVAADCVLKWWKKIEQTLSFDDVWREPYLLLSDNDLEQLHLIQKNNQQLLLTR